MACGGDLGEALGERPRQKHDDHEIERLFRRHVLPPCRWQTILNADANGTRPGPDDRLEDGSTLFAPDTRPGGTDVSRMGRGRTLPAAGYTHPSAERVHARTTRRAGGRTCKLQRGSRGLTPFFSARPGHR